VAELLLCFGRLSGGRGASQEAETMSLSPLEKARSVVDKAVAGSRRRNPRRKEPDGRTWVMLARLYAERIGEAASDPIIASAIRKAAELRALVDEVRQRALRGDETVSPDDVVRVTRLADLSVRRLFDKTKTLPMHAGPSLGDLLGGSP
jgi:hypothetical protein